MMMPNVNKAVLVVGSIVVMLSLAAWPTMIHPRLYPEYYREKQKWIRDKVPLEKTQPGGMKVWSDPFKTKREK